MNKFPHGGNLRILREKTGRSPDRIIDFSARINPLGPPEYLRKIISRSIIKLVDYPDPQGEELITVLALGLDVAEDRLLPVNGSTEIIYALPGALGCRRVIIPISSYLDYERPCRMAGLETVSVE